jgi:crotonobetainyl-CoA:carnitine CoA-transferase CaiB-like acyl-CoA transferase
METIYRPLKGLRVIELGIIVSAPTAGLIFADLGAEVIKIEDTRNGDPNRENTGSPGTGQFDFLNRNKRSLSIDLKTDTGKEIFLRLAKTADVIIENLAPGVVEKMGIGYETVKNVNENIIYCSIKGFGHGPYSHRKLTDYPAQAESGLAYMTGLRGRPMRAGASVLDMMAANMIVISTLSAIISRTLRGTKEPLKILVGMFETGAFLLGPTISRFLQTNEVPDPLNEVNFRWAVYDFFCLRDGVKMFIGIMNEKQWNAFCISFGLDSVRTDPRFITNEKRLEHKRELMAILNDLFITMTRDQIIAKLEESDILFAELNSPDKLVNHYHLSAKLLEYGSCFNDGLKLKLPGLPIEVGETVIQHATSAPKLGEHTSDILQDLGYTKDEIVKMKRKQIVK